MTIKINLGFFEIFFLILLVLKLTGHISASWFLVTMPLWGGLFLVLGVSGLMIFINSRR